MRPQPERLKRVLLVITTSDVGGSESFLALLSAGLDRRRFAPTVCSLCPPGRTGERIAAAGTPVVTLGMSPRARIDELVAAAFRLAGLIDRLQIDLVQALLYRANMLAALAGRLARRRVIVVAGQRSLAPMTGRLAAFGVRCTRRLTRATVAVSEAVQAELVLREGVDPSRVTVIGNGVDGERFRPGGRGAARRSLGIAEDAVVAGGVGRLDDAKGFEYLLQAAAEARANGARCRVLLTGDGPARPALEAEARRLGLGEAVRFLGRREDPENIYPALDVFVLPSLREGSPNVLLEAMACGVAAIASRVGGVPELIEDEVDALLVPPAEATALAAALQRLVADPSLRRRLGRAARRRVERDLTVERMVERHEALYERLFAETG